MKNFFIFTFLLVLVFSSCRKESLTPIDETETEDPKEIEGAFFKGIVTDENGGVAGTKVEIYQHEKLVGTATTDGTGAFNTLNIPLVKDVHVTFAVRQSNNEVKAKRVRENFGKSDIGTISLTENQMFDSKHEYLQNPGSNDLIVVSGYITDPMGNPANADVALLYDIVEVAPFTYETQGDGVITDENGYYELLMPKDQEFYYIAIQELCQPRLLTKNEVTILGGFPAELIGPFTEDVQLPLINKANPVTDEAAEMEVGFLAIGLQCNGSVVTNGKMAGTITKGNQTFSFDAASVANFFWWTRNYCIKKVNQNQPWIVTFTITDFGNNKVSDVLTYEITSPNQDLGSITVCARDLTEKPYVQWSVGLKSYYYEITNGLIDANGTLVSSQNPTANTGFLKFSIPNYTSGGNNIKNFTFQGGQVGETYSFNQSATDVLTVTYTQQDAKMIKGNFSGDLTGQAVGAVIPLPVTGNFVIKLP
jgi:hypothetical protein